MYGEQSYIKILDFKFLRNTYSLYVGRVGVVWLEPVLPDLRGPGLGVHPVQVVQVRGQRRHDGLHQGLCILCLGVVCSFCWSVAAANNLLLRTILWIT